MTHNINLHALAQLVPVGSRVLDLGCGDGALLDHLQKHRSCSGYGVELADTNVQACVQRGVNVLQLNLDQGLTCLLYTSPSPRDRTRSRMPSSA